MTHSPLPLKMRLTILSKQVEQIEHLANSTIDATLRRTLNEALQKLRLAQGIMRDGKR